MKKKNFILDLENLQILGKEIKNFFIDGGNYVVIKNNNNLIFDEEIIKIYEEINKNIGKIVPIDLEKNTYVPTYKYWADVKYNFDSDEKQFWRSSNHQNMHTDNTFCNSETYGNLTELVCFKTSEYSGNTTLVSNEYIIEIIKFVDKHKNDNLYESLLNKEIYHSSGLDFYLKRKILEFNEKNNKHLFCYNYFPASRGKNSEDDNNLINKLNIFLEEKIMCSDLMDEVKLNRGDAIIFNDETVLHGRRSFIGTRHYKKTSIQLDECSIFDYNNITLEKR
jgi:alpha-ketoglutarate-dependent taurine dioxygenase